jgi:hypothetical protein
MSSRHEPAGTRSYDSNPRSPYYDEPDDQAAYELAREQELIAKAETQEEERLDIYLFE